jgi:hypothetical protein
MKIIFYLAFCLKDVVTSENTIKSEGNHNACLTHSISHPQKVKGHILLTPLSVHTHKMHHIDLTGATGSDEDEVALDLAIEYLDHPRCQQEIDAHCTPTTVVIDLTTDEVLSASSTCPSNACTSTSNEEEEETTDTDEEKEASYITSSHDIPEIAFLNSDGESTDSDVDIALIKDASDGTLHIKHYANVHRRIETSLSPVSEYHKKRARTKRRQGRARRRDPKYDPLKQRLTQTKYRCQRCEKPHHYDLVWECQSCGLQACVYCYAALQEGNHACYSISMQNQTFTHDVPTESDSKPIWKAITLTALANGDTLLNRTSHTVTQQMVNDDQLLAMWDDLCEDFGHISTHAASLFDLPYFCFTSMPGQDSQGENDNPIHDYVTEDMGMPGSDSTDSI